MKASSADLLQSLSRRLIEAEEGERKRLGRELHDQVGANLSAMLLGIELIRNEVPHEAGGRLGRRLVDLEGILHDTISHVRDVLADLRPIALDELGLLAALRHQAGVLSARTGVRFVVTGNEPSPRLSPAREIAFYRIAQEAWTNALKHADCAQVTSTLDEANRCVRMCVQDDGKGFEAGEKVHAIASLGLTTMRERAEAIGAVLELATSPGAGVHLTLRLGRSPA